MKDSVVEDKVFGLSSMHQEPI
jgi:hypothetical protein